MMEKPNQSNGSGFTRNRLNWLVGTMTSRPCFFPMALETMSLQWFDKLNPGSIRNWEDLQNAFCENFVGIITHPITHAELKGLKQKGGESLRNYYRRFGKLRAQVHDITQR